MSPSKQKRSKGYAQRDRGEAPRVPLVHIWDWRAGNAHLFRSDTSLRWHMRQYRDEYVQAGAVIRVADVDFVDPAQFEQVLREIGVRLAVGHTKLRQEAVPA